MARKAIWAVLVLSALSQLTGCMGVANVVLGPPYCLMPPLPESQLVYGGVRLDAKIGAERVVEACKSDATVPERAGNLALATYLLVLDLPLSAVVDTLTIPLILHINANRKVDREHLRDVWDGKYIGENEGAHYRVPMPKEEVQGLSAFRDEKPATFDGQPQRMFSGRASGMSFESPGSDQP